MSNTTKEEIVKNAVYLFNVYGITEVSMRDIAEACGISVGNLTYYFHRKKDLVLTIVKEQLEYREQYPKPDDIDFAGFMQYVELSYNLKMTHSYYYDSFVEISRMYKEVAVIQRRLHTEVIDYFHKALLSFVKRGLIVEERYPNAYYDLANAIVMVTSFWGHHVCLTDKRPNEYAYMKNVLWGLIVPSMTGKGFEEYTEKIAPLLN